MLFFFFLFFYCQFLLSLLTFCRLQLSNPFYFESIPLSLIVHHFPYLKQIFDFILLLPVRDKKRTLWNPRDFINDCHTLCVYCVSLWADVSLFLSPVAAISHVITNLSTITARLYLLFRLHHGSFSAKPDVTKHLT